MSKLPLVPSPADQRGRAPPVDPFNLLLLTPGGGSGTSLPSPQPNELNKLNELKELI
jgi:hypothetical protein